jgi:hypothetical protein
VQSMQHTIRNPDLAKVTRYALVGLQGPACVKERDRKIPKIQNPGADGIAGWRVWSSRRLRGPSDLLACAKGSDARRRRPPSGPRQEAASADRSLTWTVCKPPSPCGYLF